MRIGLCLQGGGAKGAFQAGVLTAFSKYAEKKDISAISGTSIGAANGYFLYTGNVDKMSEFWLNRDFNPERDIVIKNNTIDNSIMIDMLRLLEDRKKDEKVDFFVNYVNIKGSSFDEIIKNIKEIDIEEGFEAITYSSLLPFVVDEGEGMMKSFAKHLVKGDYDGMILDGGVARSDLVEPLLDEKLALDKIIILAANSNYEVPEYASEWKEKGKIDVIKPLEKFPKGATMNFTYEFCSYAFEEGYIAGEQYAKKHLV